MGLPFSEILAGFFQEFLESKPFKCILQNDIPFFKYIDNILIIYPNKCYTNSAK